MVETSELLHSKLLVPDIRVKWHYLLLVCCSSCLKELDDTHRTDLPEVTTTTDSGCWLPSKLPVFYNAFTRISQDNLTDDKNVFVIPRGLKNYGFIGNTILMQWNLGSGNLLIFYLTVILRHLLTLKRCKVHHGEIRSCNWCRAAKGCTKFKHLS